MQSELNLRGDLLCGSMPVSYTHIPLSALWKVILPEVMPGIVTGALLSFTMSLDDFVISYFTSSTDQNLSMIVYSAARRGVEPTMYALSTIMFVVILLLLLVVNRRSSLEDMKN